MLPSRLLPNALPATLPWPYLHMSQLGPTVAAGLLDAVAALLADPCDAQLLGRVRARQAASEPLGSLPRGRGAPAEGPSDDDDADRAFEGGLGTLVLVVLSRHPGQLKGFASE
jgi:hypothetical protein